MINETMQIMLRNEMGCNQLSQVLVVDHNNRFSRRG